MELTKSFVLRSQERGHNRISSEGLSASYVAGHPDGFVTRESSFNFHEYQGGRPGFGTMRVLGDETFHGTGCGYNMHPHHNFLICAFVLEGELTHINTVGVGAVDRLHQGDYYVFSAGSGGKHSELSISPEDMKVIYIWLLPDQLFLPPSYRAAHFDIRTRRDRIEQLVGDADGALPISQDVRISRLVTDSAKNYVYKPRSVSHGVYVFVLEGEVRVGETLLGRRDGAGLWELESIECQVTADASDLLFVETAMIYQDHIEKWEAQHPGR
jgi:quercetin 2,3-dioxygenase